MSIGIDGRCINPSTHIRGGGYVEVECYCEAHALEAAKKYGDTEPPRVLDPNHGCLDTTVGLMRNRRRCQWEEKDREHQAAAAELAAAELAAAVDAVRRESAALFEQEYALRQGLHAANAELRAENARLESRHQDQLAEGRAANARLTEERDRLRAENETLVEHQNALLAENAELREKLAKTAEALENTRKMSWTECERLRAENAELRKGVECPLPHCECATWAREVKAGVPPRPWWLKGHHPRCVLPYAPAPDPQENAALKQAKDDAQAVAREYIEEVTEAKWNACTEDHKNCTTDRPCPVCEFGVGP